MKPTIAVTMGDPVGVGPEICLKAVASERVLAAADPVIVGDAGVLARAAKRLGMKAPSPARIISIGDLKARSFAPGRPTRASSAAMVSYIKEAVRLTVAGETQAVVTAPINKEAAGLAGFAFPGHTEYLAHLTGAKKPVMMLGGDSLKVVLVTIHEPLRKVPGLITRARVLDTIRTADGSLKMYFGIRRPRIAVAGLNPHAGETHGAGSMGTEDAGIIAPAVKKARSLGINAAGPHAPDTVFHRAVNDKEFDCVVCMYHDQGLIPLKLLHFHDGVNTTLGLPIIRTSPDHGTAYDIAWKGKAGAGSMIAAITQAAAMARAGGGKRWKR